jgi:anti-sigma-K factor RskA
MHTPDWILEQYHLGELAASEQELVEEQLVSNTALVARLEALKRSDQEILAAYTPAWFTQRVEQRIQKSRAHQQSNRTYWIRPANWMAGLRHSWRLAVPTMAAAIVLLILVLPGREERVLPDSGDQFASVRTKGIQTHLNIYRSDKGLLQILSDSTTVNMGDTLQISYVAAEARYGVILSIDGHRSVTLHHPPQTSSDTQIQQAEERFIRSYVLDDAPNFERFYFVTSNTPIDVQEILTAARLANSPSDSSAVLKLPDGYGQSTLMLRKSKASR